MMAPTIHSEIATHGWASIALGATTVSSLKQIIMAVANGLGNIVPARGNVFVESLSPLSSENARAASLSRKFGCGPLPLHCDTAHWLTPCRYIVLGCTETGNVEAPTLLLDTASIELSNTQKVLTRSASFVVRNGRKSFYASLIDGGRSFVRLDPGCMEPVSQASVEAMNLFGQENQESKTISFHWKAGDVLILDNWRMLHGRGNQSTADPNRRLLRAYVR
jgi:hypothetical protein